jgi:hypothetical protein
MENLMLEKTKNVFENKGYDLSVLEEWTEGGNIINLFDNENNICLLVVFDGEQDEFSFQRYFSLGEKTVCSVDKNFFNHESAKLVAELLNAKYE